MSNEKFINSQNLEIYSSEMVDKIKDTYNESTLCVFNKNQTISNIYNNSLACINVQGTKYGQLYGIDAVWGSSNYYVRPETGTVYSTSNRAVFLCTQGTVKVKDKFNNVKYEFQVDLCGNENVRDEIKGTAFIKRWSDDFSFNNTLNWSTGSTVNSYALFIATMTSADFGKAPAHFAQTEVANILFNTFKTESYNTVVAGTKSYSCAGMYYDDENEVYKVAFRVNANFFSSPTQFAFEMGTGNSNMKLICRYELLEYINSPLSIAPIIIEEDDVLTFEPSTELAASDVNGQSYTLKTDPYSLNISVYGNIGAKIEGANEKNLLISLTDHVLNGASNTNESVIEDIEDGEDIGNTIQAQIDYYTQTGGIVYIKEGSYTLSQTITIPKNVTVQGLGEVIVDYTPTSGNVFELKCGAKLKSLQIKTPVGFTGSAVMIGETDVNYTELSTSVDDLKIIGRTVTDGSGNTTTFTGKGVSVVAQHSENDYCAVYSACGSNLKVYNYQYGIYVYADGVIDFIANTYFENMYIENCWVGIYDKGYSSAFIGYTVQTKPNNKYGVECYGGYYMGHVYDCDFYNNNDPNRPNIGHPKYAYFLGGSIYSYITDPVATEFQNKYGYEWDTIRAEKKLAHVDNTWHRYRTVNETVTPLRLSGEEFCNPKERYTEFNGLIDNFICYANEKWTVTTNIVEADIIQGEINDMFNPNKSAWDSLKLRNRTTDNPYIITIDFGETITLSALGMDFHSIPRYVKMESYIPAYETTTDTSNNFSDDHFLEVYFKNDNRLSVVQSTWSGTGLSTSRKIRFTFADASLVANENGYIQPTNLYAYNLERLAQVYLPSNGGHIYNSGGITVDSNKTTFSNNELVPKSYVDTHFTLPNTITYTDDQYSDTFVTTKEDGFIFANSDSRGAIELAGDTIMLTPSYSGGSYGNTYIQPNGKLEIGLYNSNECTVNKIYIEDTTQAQVHNEYPIIDAVALILDLKSRVAALETALESANTVIQQLTSNS